LAAGCAQGPSSVVDHRAVLESFDWWDNRDWDWYEAKIPFFESPDPELDATYYYRWELITKHLTYGSPQTGYAFTEFIDRPFWSGAYGAISCPLGHQFYEIRWMKDRRAVEDFARYWFETPGAEPRRYSNWYGDAMWATYSVTGDTAFLRKVYPHMESQMEGWMAERWDPEHRMFRWVGAWDGMETNINSRLTDDAFGGGEGYRPTLNSYLYADLLALSRTAALFGESGKTAEFEARAGELKTRVLEELWDPDREFFFHQFANDEKDGIRAGTLTYETGPFAGDPHGRELIGYVPWQFNLPDPGYEAAWRFLTDPEYFRGPRGLTTVEQGDPQFFISPRCCVWSGNTWPYATTQTLVALANVLNGYQQSYVDRSDYSALLLEYARSHRSEGRPYITEAADPRSGSWEGHNSFYHSEHYFHSGFVDLVITGLVGLRPRADDTLEVNPLAPEEWPYFALEGVDYHGHDLNIVWDRDGTRYGGGSGLLVRLDGRELARVPELTRLKVPIPPPVSPEAKPRLHNYAVNNERAFFPSATASSYDPLAPPFYAVDGRRWYHLAPPNRWVASPQGQSRDPSLDWFQVDFGTTRRLTEVRLYFLDDVEGPPVEVAGDGEESGFGLGSGAGALPVRPPASYEVEYWDGRGWVEVPGQVREPPVPVGRRANTTVFPEIATAMIRVLLRHRPGTTSGFTEMEAWGPGELPLPAPTAPVPNLALNTGGEPFPRVTASFTHEGDPVEEAADGVVAFTRYSRNRWTAYGSPNAEDWLEVDFGAPRPVGRIELFLFGDGSGVGAPRDYQVQIWARGAWREAAVLDRVPKNPTAWACNTVRLTPTSTPRVRLVLRHDGPLRAGVTELRIYPE
jgi:hypothetical protein